MNGNLYVKEEVRDKLPGKTPTTRRALQSMLESGIVDTTTIRATFKRAMDLHKRFFMRYTRSYGKINAHIEPGFYEMYKGKHEKREGRTFVSGEKLQKRWSTGVRS